MKLKWYGKVGWSVLLAHMTVKSYLIYYLIEMTYLSENHL